MSVRPITFNEDGSIDYYYDEEQHSGTIPQDQINFLSDPISGQINHNVIILECQDNCGGISWHPVSGGAAPKEVQEMFVRKFIANGASALDAIAETKSRCIAMDGEDRWQVDEPALLSALNAAK